MALRVHPALEGRRLRQSGRPLSPDPRKGRTESFGSVDTALRRSSGAGDLIDHPDRTSSTMSSVIHGPICAEPDVPSGRWRTRPSLRPGPADPPLPRRASSSKDRPQSPPPRWPPSIGRPTMVAGGGHAGVGLVQPSIKSLPPARSRPAGRSGQRSAAFVAATCGFEVTSGRPGNCLPRREPTGGFHTPAGSGLSPSCHSLASSDHSQDERGTMARF